MSPAVYVEAFLIMAKCWWAAIKNEKVFDSFCAYYYAERSNEMRVGLRTKVLMKIVGSEPKFQSCFNTPSKREMKAGLRREAPGEASGTISLRFHFI